MVSSGMEKEVQYGKGKKGCVYAGLKEHEGTSHMESSSEAKAS